MPGLISSSPSYSVTGQVCRDIREKGMDTIICLDVSSSMKGEGWNQAMAFVKGFIECKFRTVWTVT